LLVKKQGGEWQLQAKEKEENWKENQVLQNGGSVG
jgi:hypothetical protein